MIFGLHPLFGFLPLLLYIVLMMMGKDMNVSVLLCVILGAILTGESITGFADTLYASLGSFCALIGFIIVLGSGLAEVLSQTKVAHNLVYMVVNRFKLKSKKMAILISMITSTLLVSLLGTLAGSNAIIAPILIPIVASVGLTPSTLGVILHGAGATGLYVGPFVPPVVTITGLTGLSYGQYLITAGIPLAVIVWGSTFFMACRTQRKTEALEAYEESGEDASAFVPDARCKRATLAFLLVMAVMLGYGLVVGAGASYAILVMMTASIVVGLVGGLSFQSSLTAMIQGGSKMFWMFFMFVLFEPFLNYVSASGAFDAVCQLMQPLIDVGGEVAFLMLSAAVGIFGISGTGVAQAQIIHELFLPMVQSLNIAMPIWGMVVLVGCQVTFFVTPTVDMVGQMGLARSKNIKAMLANGWVITVITFAYVLIRAILYTMWPRTPVPTWSSCLRTGPPVSLMRCSTTWRTSWSRKTVPLSRCCGSWPGSTRSGWWAAPSPPSTPTARCATPPSSSTGGGRSWVITAKCICTATWTSMSPSPTVTRPRSMTPSWAAWA